MPMRIEGITDPVQPPTVISTIRLARRCKPLFLAEWLTKAAEAELILKSIRAENWLPRALDRLDGSYLLELDHSAIDLLAMTLPDRSACIESHSYEAELMVVLTHLGFFVRRRKKWFFGLPESVTREDVTAALLALVETQDEHCMLHPETLPPFAIK